MACELAELDRIVVKALQLPPLIVIVSAVIVFDEESMIVAPMPSKLKVFAVKFPSKVALSPKVAVPPILIEPPKIPM